MADNFPANPKLMKLYLAAKKLAKQKAELARMKRALENWPTKKTKNVEKPTTDGDT